MCRTVVAEVRQSETRTWDPLYAFKTGVWCSMGTDRITGPIIFGDRDRETNYK
jgi:hypothetical protein